MTPEFRDCVQFLYWSGGSIKVATSLPREQREKLVEDAYQALKVGGKYLFTVFCEDESHKAYFEILASRLGIDEFYASRCGDSANVKSLYLRSLEEGGWANCLFVIDGDGQGSWKHAGVGFHHLTKYCVENFAFSIEKAEAAYGRTSIEVRSKLASLLKEKKRKLFSKSKSLDFLVDLLQEDQITQERIDHIDASEFLSDFIAWLGYNTISDFWNAIFDKCNDVDCEVTFEDFVDSRVLTTMREWANKTPHGTQAGGAGDLKGGG